MRLSSYAKARVATQEQSRMNTTDYSLGSGYSSGSGRLSFLVICPIVTPVTHQKLTFIQTVKDIIMLSMQN